MLKVIYIYERRFPYRGDDIRFGYNIFLHRGYEVEVWSIAKWTYGLNGDSKTLSGGARIDGAEYVKIINSKDEFLKNIGRINKEKCFFLLYPYSGFCEISFYIRRILYEKNIPFANISMSTYLHGIDKKLNNINIVWIILMLFRNFIVRNAYYLFKWMFSLGNNRKFLKEVTDSIYSFFGYLLYPSVYNFVTTTFMYSRFPNPMEKYSKRNVLICSNSYDEYLESIDTKRVIEEKYIVFIDTGILTLDNRCTALGEDIPVKNKEKYCNDMKMLFDCLEEEYHCPVVIAAHPKAGYIGNEFGDRMMIFGKTPQLVKDAELVVNEISTAFGLAVLHKKDVLEVYTTEMFENAVGWRKSYVDYEKMGFKLLNIADKTQVKRVKEYIFVYNENAYKEYIDILIKSKGSIGEGKTFYQCVYEYIDKWRIEKGWSIKE